MLRRSRRLVLALLLVGACQNARTDTRDSSESPAGVAPGAATAATADSATAFVRAFYSTYAPREIASGLAALDSLVAERPMLFTPKLRSVLERDVVARAVADGEIVGLDFLPFLGTQDPCERYEVGDAQSPASESAEVRVPIHAVCAGHRAPGPAAVVAVRRAQDGWAITNVNYPQDTSDLLAALARD